MSSKIYITFAVGCGFAISVGLHAQQPNPPAQQQEPASAQQPTQKPPAEANPFPQDTSNVPTIPINGEPATAPAPAAESAGTTSLLKNDTDPVHSPDDPTPDTSGGSGFSSSLTGANDVNIPDEEKPGKHRKLEVPDKVHQETAKEDESVGEFELSRKNWKAALSRFQSALVTDSENPDVFWGIAEAQRELGDYANAKANYQKVVDYDDPESKHSKEAKKLLKTPELANAPAVSKNQGHPQ